MLGYQILVTLYVIVDDLYQSHIQPCTLTCGGPPAYLYAAFPLLPPTLPGQNWRLMRGCPCSSCHQAGENGCSCQHTWHILGTRLSTEDFEPDSCLCPVRNSHTICQSLTEKVLWKNLLIPGTRWPKTLLPTPDKHNRCRCLTALPMGRTMDQGRSAIRLFATIEACPYTVGCRGLQAIQPPLWMT
jgi:hypothetical protein